MVSSTESTGHERCPLFRTGGLPLHSRMSIHVSWQQLHGIRGCGRHSSRSGGWRVPARSSRWDSLSTDSQVQGSCCSASFWPRSSSDGASPRPQASNLAHGSVVHAPTQESQSGFAGPDPDAPSPVASETRSGAANVTRSGSCGAMSGCAPSATSGWRGDGRRRHRRRNARRSPEITQCGGPGSIDPGPLSIPPGRAVTSGRSGKGASVNRRRRNRPNRGRHCHVSRRRSDRPTRRHPDPRRSRSPVRRAPTSPRTRSGGRRTRTSP